MIPAPDASRLIAETATLNRIVGKARNAALIAIDTEFVRERTYFPELCVLQIASEDFAVAIDCLAGLDLDPLFEALLADDRPWVLHSARQDLEVLYQRCGRLPAVLVDTQVGAALLGYPLQIGLQRLLQDLLGVSLGKEHTRTDWSRRPLPEAALQYAVDDVRYLLPAWREIEQRLGDAGRAAWFVEDCDRLLHLPIEPDAAAILEKTRGAGALRGRQRDGALALVGWRESRARERNKPRRWILADDQLVRIAAALPGSVAELERLPGLPARLVSRSGKALVKVLAEAEPVPDAPALPPPDKAVIKAIQQDVRAAAEAIGVQPELLATRRDIALAAAGHPPSAFTSGWRSALIGDLAKRVSPGQSS